MCWNLFHEISIISVSKLHFLFRADEMFRVPAMVVKSSKGTAMLKFYVSIKQFDMHDSINNSVIYLALDDKALVFSVEFA